MRSIYLAVTVAFGCSGYALAQQGGPINSVTVSPSPAKVGQAVTVTINTDGEPPKYCGLRVEYGDSSEDFKIDQNNKQFPVVVTHTFGTPGTYTIKARGKTVTTHARCQGEAQSTIVIEAAAPAVAAVAGPLSCPDGYKLKGKVGKAGDFTCQAAKGAKPPEKVLACGDGLEYFQSKTTAGCRKTKK
jgi:hypothetical protein